MFSKDQDYVVSFKFIKDNGRAKFFSVWIAYLPIRRKCHWCKNPIKRSKVLYSKAAVNLWSTNGVGPKFFLPTPIGICALYGENTRCLNEVCFISCLCYEFPKEMTLNVGEVGCPVGTLHCLKGNGLMDFKVKLTNLFRKEQGAFKAGWKLNAGYYDGIQMWDFHMGWDYHNGAYHYKFVPNKNFK